MQTTSRAAMPRNCASTVAAADAFGSFIDSATRMPSETVASSQGPSVDVSDESQATVPIDGNKAEMTDLETGTFCQVEQGRGHALLLDSVLQGQRDGLADDAGDAQMTPSVGLNRPERHPRFVTISVVHRDGLS